LWIRLGPLGGLGSGTRDSFTAEVAITKRGAYGVPWPAKVAVAWASCRVVTFQ